MSAIDAPRNFEDLYTDLQNRVREQTGETATENQAKRFINIAVQDMHIGWAERMPWAEKRAVLLTAPKYSTGLVTIDKGSQTLTGVSDADGNPTVWTTTNDFGVANATTTGKIVIAGGSEVYGIDTVAASTITLSTKYIGTTIDGTTQTDDGAAYYYFADEYDLASDFLSPIDQRQFTDGINLPLISRTEFRRIHVRNHIPGRPRIASMTERISSANVVVRQVRFHPPPDTVMQVPYSYVTKELSVSGTATGTITFSGLPTATDTLVLNGTTWTFVSAAASDSTLIGTTLSETIASLARDLSANDTGDTSIDDANYTAVEGIDSVLHIKYKVSGSAGTAYTTVASGTSVATASGAALAVGGSLENMVDPHDEPTMPVIYRMAILYHALYHWYRDKKDDARSAEAKAEYTDFLSRVVGDNEIGSARPILRPNVHLYKRKARRPWGGAGTRRYDIKGRFDRMEN
jgi:hypothetical protein